MLPLERETERLSGPHALHLHASFVFCIFCLCGICLFDGERPFIRAYLVRFYLGHMNLVLRKITVLFLQPCPNRTQMAKTSPDTFIQPPRDHVE